MPKSRERTLETDSPANGHRRDRRNSRRDHQEFSKSPPKFEAEYLLEVTEARTPKISDFDDESLVSDTSTQERPVARAPKDVAIIGKAALTNICQWEIGATYETDLSYTVSEATGYASSSVRDVLHAMVDQKVLRRDDLGSGVPALEITDSGYSRLHRIEGTENDGSGAIPVSIFADVAELVLQ